MVLFIFPYFFECHKDCTKNNSKKSAPKNYNSKFFAKMHCTKRKCQYKEAKYLSHKVFITKFLHTFLTLWFCLCEKNIIPPAINGNVQATSIEPIIRNSPILSITFLNLILKRNTINKLLQAMLKMIKSKYYNLFFFQLFIFSNNHLNSTKCYTGNTKYSNKCSKKFISNNVRRNEGKCNQKITNYSCKVAPKFITKIPHNFFQCLLFLPFLLMKKATKGSKKAIPNIPTKMFPKIFSITFLNSMFNPNTINKCLQAISLLLIFIFNANAGVGDSMESFWSGLGDNANYTQGGTYKSQTNTYYSGPSVYARSKVVSVNPVSIQAPRIRGGCNGIDMFAGSFSHINADQFVNLLKQIPNNAKGFAFQLMLDTISPTVSTQLKSMLATLEKINAMNLNSCDIAAGAVGGVASLFSEKKQFCQTAQTMSLRASDWAKGVNECGAGGQTNATNKNPPARDQVDQKALADHKITDVNLAWEALRNSGLDNEVKEVFQSISGTIIKRAGGNDDTPDAFESYPSRAIDPEFFDSLLNGGSIPTYKCRSDFDLCLEIANGNTNLPIQSALKVKIKTQLDSIAEKLTGNGTGSTLSDPEKALVDKVSTIPIISMLKVKVLNGGVSKAKNENLSLSEIIAIELLYIYIEEVFTSIIKDTDGMKKGGDDTKKFATNLITAHKMIEERRKINLQKLTLTNQVLQQVHEIEKVISQSSKSNIFK